jgi:hypothetical protein
LMDEKNSKTFGVPGRIRGIKHDPLAQDTEVFE